VGAQEREEQRFFLAHSLSRQPILAIVLILLSGMTSRRRRTGPLGVRASESTSRLRPSVLVTDIANMDEHADRSSTEKKDRAAFYPPRPPYLYHIDHTGG
jgi:hypothetical protein